MRQRLHAIKNRFSELKAFLKRYERWLMPVTLFTGFVADYITFVSIQVNTALWLLFAYWILAGLIVLFTYAYDFGKVSLKFRYLRLFAPLITQFLFGGLLSNSFIFYWFSGSLYSSWPFILLFVFLMVGNEALRHWFFKPVVQLGVYFFGTISFASVALPFLFNSVEPKYFVFGSLASLVAFFFYLFLLFWLLPQTRRLVPSLFLSAILIAAVMNLFYFKNLIPPVPLALRESGIYHNLKRLGGSYVLSAEKENFFSKIWPGQTAHFSPGGRLYVFTAIFAPKNLNAPIFHHWQYYDQKKGEWVEKDVLSFTLTGGRKEGFRGYSYKTVVAEGKWRVLVKTSRGQTLGVVKFAVLQAVGQVELNEIVK
jgi:hypothetical protein